jgi:uncharacterized protein with HEPN domain|tara:strand:+ start:237 stop:626 length:390 start_codon:yes stop_codon:yes gene_type:complete
LLPTERTAQRIHDILRNIASIEAYTEALTKDSFRETPMAVDAVERCLERIAEAARKIGDQFDAAMPDGVDLRAIRQFGSVLRHDYDAVDTAIIWNVIDRDLPNLKTAFQALQKEHPLPNIKTDPNFDPF